MKQQIFQFTIVVLDYDEAIEFYTEKLNFELLEDTIVSPEKRWVRIAPPGSSGCNLLLAKAKNEQEKAAVGNQTGGRVGFFLHTDDVHRDYLNLKFKGVRIVREPVAEPFGNVLVFADLYGNLWDLIQPNA
ncbi:MAG: VOC family protein [Saprospiraceae bacterium]